MIDTQTAGSPGWWFDRLAQQLTNRSTRLTTLRDYLTGNAPLPEGANGLRQAYQEFQKKARTNFAELVVEAVQERMRVAGFRIAEEGLAAEANRIWSVNEMATASTDVHGDMLGLSEGYVMIGPNGDTPILTYEDPRYCIAEHDPLHPSVVRAALKMYRDDEEGREYAYVYLPGAVMRAWRDSSLDPSGTSAITTDVSGFDWVRDSDDTAIVVRLPAPVVPIVRFRNRGAVGEFETHTDVLDRINYGILQRLVTASMQAYRQRAVKGELPEKDESGEPIDYGPLFRPGPGALWMLPEGVDLWESQYTDLTPMLSAVKDDIRDLAAVTRTPMSVFIPDAANQSAEGAAFAREGLVWKAQDRIARATYGWNTVMRIALAFAGYDSVNVETEWLDPERRSLSERADAASKLVPAGVSWRTLMRDVMQFPPDKVEQMEAERTADTFDKFLAEPDQLQPAPAENDTKTLKDATWMTVNEKRAAQGLKALPDGDAIYMPASEIPAIEVAPAPAAAATEKADMGMRP